MAFISNGTTILDNGAFSLSLGNQVLIKEVTARREGNFPFELRRDVHKGTLDLLWTLEKGL